ncbi:hypothetical protein STIAU_4267 [Stigmatella aurantiaca DW4/3-1]|uniref:Uncharacterized protein n=1 Tax=Stigmatella aurantiaca (strain DW4/3-1) TaxID=378806 RepID=Q092P8_STIAD|nr:hypothetical protein STIAU_4267 [Stigmatella aurantiaca DW4/3-1]
MQGAPVPARGDLRIRAARLLERQLGRQRDDALELGIQAPQPLQVEGGEPLGTQRAGLNPAGEGGHRGEGDVLVLGGKRTGRVLAPHEAVARGARLEAGERRIPLGGGGHGGLQRHLARARAPLQERGHHGAPILHGLGAFLGGVPHLGELLRLGEGGHAHLRTRGGRGAEGGRRAGGRGGGRTRIGGGGLRGPARGDGSGKPQRGVGQKLSARAGHGLSSRTRGRESAISRAGRTRRECPRLRSAWVARVQRVRGLVVPLPALVELVLEFHGLPVKAGQEERQLGLLLGRKVLRERLVQLAVQRGQLGPCLEGALCRLIHLGLRRAVALRRALQELRGLAHLFVQGAAALIELAEDAVHLQRLGGVQLQLRGELHQARHAQLPLHFLPPLGGRREGPQGEQGHCQQGHSNLFHHGVSPDQGRKSSSSEARSASPSIQAASSSPRVMSSSSCKGSAEAHCSKRVSVSESGMASVDSAPERKEVRPGSVIVSTSITAAAEAIRAPTLRSRTARWTCSRRQRLTTCRGRACCRASSKAETGGNATWESTPAVRRASPWHAAHVSRWARTWACSAGASAPAACNVSSTS